MFDSIILHIPHSSLDLPAVYLGDITCPDEVLRLNVSREADLYVDQLFHVEGLLSLKPRFSRHVCDVERFRNDCDEPESRRGRGLFYTHFEDGGRFRKYSDELRRKVLTELYDPHHARLAREVKDKLRRHGLCRIIDCHSFSDIPGYPDFCIGADPFHTPDNLPDRLQNLMEQAGYSVRINFPYSGSIVPMACYRRDSRVESVMIEVNKRLYMNEATFAKNDAFTELSKLCRELVGLIAVQDKPAPRVLPG